MRRCSWVNLNNPLYVQYHDEEWGRPIHEEHQLFELLILEGAQAGLSWETVLNKRVYYRKAFENFDPAKVARFTSKKVEKLLENPGLIRHRLKITSAISNAKFFLAIQQEFGSFDNYIWSFVNFKPMVNRYRTTQEYPSKTPLSDTISKDLKKRGFKFVGSTIIYAYLQAIGVVNDHVVSCSFKAQR
ncbi:MAG TPA: DNA-3-methyladenine glycosylase I [Gammaproteobacteria bacterium]|nr:DNA-3-methyladenine glycosylase I [Gammaproteobacteria bacterium]